MPLRLKLAADQFPGAGWERDNDRLVVMAGEIVMGSMTKLVAARATVTGQWSITRVIAPPDQAAMFGVEPTREEAQECLARAWRRAGLKEER